MVALAAGLLAAGPADAAKRLALVIGIDSYDHLPKLQKAVNDGRAVAAALTENGFDVVYGEDLSRREINAKLAELDAKVAPGDTVFFFFAGHGSQSARRMARRIICCRAICLSRATARKI